MLQAAIPVDAVMNVPAFGSLHCFGVQIGKQGISGHAMVLASCVIFGSEDKNACDLTAPYRRSR